MQIEIYVRTGLSYLYDFSHEEADSSSEERTSDEEIYSY